MEVEARDVAILSIFLGVMVATMAFFMHIFASGLDTIDLARSARAALLCGITAWLVVVVYMTSRYLDQSRGDGVDPDEIRVEMLRDNLGGVESSAARLPWAAVSPWTRESHVRHERGTLTLDLHDLDQPQAREAVEAVFALRDDLGRVRIITGRGKHSKTAPKLRPMVIEMLREVADDLNWQVILKAGSITLRPTGVAPSPARFIARLILMGIPVTAAMVLSMEELAGSGASEQGQWLGLGLGVALSLLLASHRVRSA